MKKFLLKSIFFILIIVGITFSSFLILSFSEKKVLLDEQKIIIAGDSNTEVAINDQIISSVINISRSGESYFYTYYKLRHLLEVNEHVEKVYLSFSPHNIVSKERNLFTNGKLYNNFIEYTPVIDFESIYYLLKEDKKNVFLSFLKAPFYLVKHNFSSPLWGGYIKLDRSNLANQIKNVDQFLVYYSQKDIDILEINYLQKISSLLNKNEVELILINTPKWIDFFKYSNSLKLYHEVYKKEFLNIKLLDYSSLYNEEEFFGDFTHLNYKGGQKFTDFFISKILNSKIDSN